MNPDTFSQPFLASLSAFGPGAPDVSSHADFDWSAALFAEVQAGFHGGMSGLAAALRYAEQNRPYPEGFTL